MKKIFIVTLVLTMLCLTILRAEAANRYVRAGATGNNTGSDWTNAYTTLPATLIRGDTYYIGDGSYGGYTFDDANSGTTVITIRKATVADHGTSVGWSDTFGDGQAFFNDPGAGTWAFNTSYWSVEGNQGSGKSNLGFVVTNGKRIASDLIRFAGGVHHITIDKIDASQQVFGGAEGNLNDVFYGASGGNNLTITNCFIHETNWFAAVLLIGWDRVTFDGNYFENNYRKEILSCRDCTNLTWRDNIHHNGAGTGYLVLQNPVGVNIYNNVFYITDSSYSTTDCLICNWFGQGMSATNINIYGNTFYNVENQAVIGFDNPTNVVVKNNLFYGPSGISFRGTMTHDYNWCAPSERCSAVASEAHGQIGGTGSPFANAANANFRLINTTNAGQTLPSPFDVDMTGGSRGPDGVWDRGAFEFQGGVANLPPSSPSNLRVQ